MFDNDLESDDNIQNVSEYSKENLEHLKRLEQDFLNDLKTQEFVKSVLETVMFNSFSVFLSLWLIHVNVTLLLATLAGFSIGAIPGIKKITDNFSINQNDENDMRFSVNGKFITGILQIVFSGFLIVSGATQEWRSVEHMAKMSAEQFQIQRENYEKDRNESINFEMKWLLMTGLGAAGGVMLLGFLKNSTKDL